MTSAVCISFSIDEGGSACSVWQMQSEAVVIGRATSIPVKLVTTVLTSGR